MTDRDISDYPTPSPELMGALANRLGIKPAPVRMVEIEYDMSEPDPVNVEEVKAWFRDGPRREKAYGCRRCQCIYVAQPKKCEHCKGSRFDKGVITLHYGQDLSQLIQKHNDVVKNEPTHGRKGA